MHTNSIKQILFEKGVSQIQLSFDTGINQSRLSNIVNGWVLPRPIEKAKLAKALNVNVGDLWMDETVRKVVNNGND